MRCDARANADMTLEQHEHAQQAVRLGQAQGRGSWRVHDDAG